MAVRVVDDDIAKVRLLAGLCSDDLYIFVIRMLYLFFLQLIYYLTSIFTLIVMFNGSALWLCFTLNCVIVVRFHMNRTLTAC